MKTVPVPIIGMLIQKIHLQDTFWEKAPPISGPVTDPIAHILPRYPNHATLCQLRVCYGCILTDSPPRADNGTRSVTSISPSVRIPPPPIPCMDRPMSLRKVNEHRVEDYGIYVHHSEICGHCCHNRSNGEK